MVKFNLILKTPVKVYKNEDKKLFSNIKDNNNDKSQSSILQKFRF